MKYKAGDKVKVRSDLKISVLYGSLYPIDEMANKKIITITSVHDGYYKVVEDDYMWTDGMLDGLVEEELTAEEATRILGEICCENKCYNRCPIGKARGEMSCNIFRRDKPKEVIEILKQFKKDHEKKEIEVVQKIYCLVIGEKRTVVHEEKIGDSDSCPEVLKRYCEEHDGKFFTICESRYEVKE